MYSSKQFQCGCYIDLSCTPLFITCNRNYIFVQFGLYQPISVNGRLGSLQAIVNTMNVDIVTANETNLKGSNKLNLEGYSSFARNQTSNVMGGIATCVKNEYKNSTLKLSSGNTVEYIVTRHGQFNPAVNIIDMYGLCL